MKELLDEINSLKLEYPEYAEEFEYILDMCLKDMEKGENKNKCIFIAKRLIWQVIQEDK